MSAAADRSRDPAEPLLRVDGLAKHFPVTAGVFGRTVGQVKAVDGVSFELARGRTLGLVGESGCGKTTVGQSIVRLLEPTDGRIVFDGRDITHAPLEELRDLRRKLQFVFQDPFGSLNPRMTVADIVGEAVEVHGIARGDEVQPHVLRVLARVGIPAAWIDRYPHEFSGGQRQRISIARAIALEPQLVVCDEAVSALDVSIQAQVINLLIELQREMGLAYVFISHDLSVVRHISDDVCVMYLGQVVESAPTDELFDRPAHPYARSLLSAIPVPDPARRSERIVLQGDVPTPLDPPPGCRFHTRCPVAVDRCSGEEPPAFAVGPGDAAVHRVKCWHVEGLAGDPDWYARVEERSRAASPEAAAPAQDAPDTPRASRFALAAKREAETEPATAAGGPAAAGGAASLASAGSAPTASALPRLPSLPPRTVAALLAFAALLDFGFGGIALGACLAFAALSVAAIGEPRESRRAVVGAVAVAALVGIAFGVLGSGWRASRAAEAQLAELEGRTRRLRRADGQRARSVARSRLARRASRNRRGRYAARPVATALDLRAGGRRRVRTRKCRCRRWSQEPTTTSARCRWRATIRKARAARDDAHARRARSGLRARCRARRGDVPGDARATGRFLVRQRHRTADDRPGCDDRPARGPRRDGPVRGADALRRA